ncbi:uncharacterized protein LOC108632570 [Ceratina calcarata]|uniref:Uncharacterized protein LOC108632570 n=1 Tax=Ceratina calcarata TaxID=156304 RepID=A0AAJ7NFL1_9HYME|nr:uncharacterized protein LOC108632570 [Ceratina calcarata]
MERSVIALRRINGSGNCYEERSVSLFFRLPSIHGASTHNSLCVHGTMKNNLTFVVVLAIFVVVVDGRVYYLPSLDENRYSDLTYPIPNEQSSRDLDLSFSAGESNDLDNKIRTFKKVYTAVAPERPLIEMNKEELPITRYKLVEAPVKRLGSDDVIVIPELNRKTVKIDGNNKGEVILELRVIANHGSA